MREYWISTIAAVSVYWPLQWFGVPWGWALLATAPAIVAALALNDAILKRK